MPKDTETLQHGRPPIPDRRLPSPSTRTSFGRAAQPVELSPIYVFLASNESRFVTGEVYGATGGQTPY